MQKTDKTFNLKISTTERPEKIEVHLTEAENAQLQKRFPDTISLVRHLRTILGFDN